MKNAVIIYISIHHKNTEKVVKYISEELSVDSLTIKEARNLDLTEYNLIIMASGIYYNSLHKELLEWFKNADLKNKIVGILYICGFKYRDYAKNIGLAVTDKGGSYIGSCWCRGYDTYGPLAKIGGIARKHPNKHDLNKIKKQVEKWIYYHPCSS